MKTTAKDAGDLLRNYGPRDGARKVMAAIENSATVETQAGKTDRNSPRPIIRRMADCAPERIEWLWDGRFPLGSVSIIGGIPGEGKSTLTCLIAAHVTTGKAWPDGATNGGPGDVVFITSEDDVSTVTRPRFEAMGGDVKRATILDAMSIGGKELLFELGSNGINVLEQVLADEPAAKLVVIDPISSVLGKTDSHRDADVRHMLRPLAELARKHKVAVIMVGHLNKSQMGNALERFGGSIGFVAIARVAHLFVSDKHDKTLRWFVEVKKNFGPRLEGLAFRVVSSSDGSASALELIERGNPPTADEALAAVTANATPGKRRSKVALATDWLEDFLARGPRLQTEVIEEGQTAGHSKKTLERAKEKLGYASKKLGAKDPWAWYSPDDYDDEDDTDLMADLAVLEKGRRKGHQEHSGEDPMSVNLTTFDGGQIP